METEKNGKKIGKDWKKRIVKKKKTDKRKNVEEKKKKRIWKRRKGPSSWLEAPPYIYEKSLTETPSVSSKLLSPSLNSTPNLP